MDIRPLGGLDPTRFVRSKPTSRFIKPCFLPLFIGRRFNAIEQFGRQLESLLLRKKKGRLAYLRNLAHTSFYVTMRRKATTMVGAPD